MVQPIVEEVPDTGSNPMDKEEEEDFIRGSLTPEVENLEKIDERGVGNIAGQNPMIILVMKI